MTMRTLFVITISIVLFSCSGTRNVDKKQAIYVYAAASLSDVISEIADSFSVGKKVEIKLNLAASGTLARQIEQGAEADVYISANKSWMNYLMERNLSRETACFAGNDLVLIASPDDSVDVTDVVSFLKQTNEKIAIGDPGYVPAGKYAQQVFNHYHLDLSSKLFQTADVRSALMVVEMGEVRYGIVYKSDAIQSGKVHIIYTFPEESHEPVSYFKLLISEKALAKDFYNYLYSAEAKAILTKYQFKNE